MGRYREEFRRSLADPDQFWRDASELIDWFAEPSVVLDRSNPAFHRWFAGGMLNTCFNAVDRHVRDGRAGQPALIYNSPVTGSRRVLTYQEFVVLKSGSTADPPAVRAELAQLGLTRSRRW